MTYEIGQMVACAVSIIIGAAAGGYLGTKLGEWWFNR